MPTPSKYQQAFYNEVENGTGNIALKARAGSGKTYSIIEACKKLPYAKQVSTIVLAFNKAIQQEIEAKCKKEKLSITCKTTYSAAYSALATCIGGRPNLDDSKYPKLIKEIMLDFGYKLSKDEDADDDNTPLYDALKESVRYCQLTLTDATDIEAFEDMMNHYDIQYSDAEELARITERVLEVGASQVKMIISFTDMIWIPVRLGMACKKWDIIFVDECQDLSNCQREIVKKMCHATTRVIAVGDPQQAIMGFAGAGINSMQQIIDEFKCQVMPLSICYRCPTSHLDRVREIVPDIEDAPGAKLGTTIHCDSIESLPSLLNPADEPLVMCRINAPLIQLAFELLAAGVPATLKGRDLLGQLVNLAKQALGATEGKRDEKKAVVDWRNFKTLLDSYVAKQVEALNKKSGTEMRIQNLQDRADSLNVVIGRAIADPEWNLQTIKDLRNYLDKLYSPKRGVVTLASVHKSKGLEAKVTVILGPEIMPHKMATVDWQKEQEQNLIYVAESRSMDTKIYCPLPKRNDDKKASKSKKSDASNTESKEDAPTKNRRARRSKSATPIEVGVPALSPVYGDSSAINGLSLNDVSEYAEVIEEVVA